MEDKKSDVNTKHNGSLNVNISAGDNKIKYYECNKDNCIFEILDDKDIKKDEPVEFDEIKYEDDDSDANNDFEFFEEKKYYNKDNSNRVTRGKIIVKSIIDYGKKEILSGVKINLYKINGLSPVLIKTAWTDKSGKAVFDNVKDGCYRVIEIVDKKYFEKPKYMNWNEITINSNNNEEKILIINKIRSHRN